MPSVSVNDIPFEAKMQHQGNLMFQVSSATLLHNGYTNSYFRGHPMVIFSH